MFKDISEGETLEFKLDEFGEIKEHSFDEAHEKYQEAKKNFARHNLISRHGVPEELITDAVLDRYWQSFSFGHALIIPGMAEPIILDKERPGKNRKEFFHFLGMTFVYEEPQEDTWSQFFLSLFAIIIDEFSKSLKKSNEREKRKKEKEKKEKGTKEKGTNNSFQLFKT